MNHRSFYLEEKELYTLFNEVKYNQSEFDQTDDEIPEILKEKIKKKLLKATRNSSYLKIAKRGSIAAAILLVILIGLGAASPALARNVPLVQSIFQFINEKFGGYEQYSAFSQLVNNSVTDNGITLTVNEALADDGKLILGYTIKSNSKIENLHVVGLMRFVRINGSTVGGGGSAGEYLDDTTYVGSDEIYYNSTSSSDQLKVDLNVDDIMGVKGEWNFAFTVSKAELVKETTVFKADDEIELPECFVKVDKVVFTPIGNTIYFIGNYKDKNNGVMDSVAFYRWIIFDDKGIELLSVGGSGSFGGNTDLSPGKEFEGTAQFQAVKNIPKYITVIPCRVQATNANDERLGKKDPAESLKIIDGNYLLELSQGKMGKLIIKDIKTANGETVVSYTAEGKAPYFQATHLYLKDADGNYVIPKRYANRKDEEHPNNFTMVFQALEAGKQYSAATSQFTNVDLMEDQKIEIVLNK